MTAWQDDLTRMNGVRYCNGMMDLRDMHHIALEHFKCNSTCVYHLLRLLTVTECSHTNVALNAILVAQDLAWLC
jgi:hypothetical protein